MQAFLNAEAGLHSALPFTAACVGDHPWATGSHGQLNCEKDAPHDGGCWGQPPQAAARPTAGATTPPARGRVQSLRFMPGVSSSPAHALALLNSSSLAHRGRYGSLPGMSNLLPHGPFGTVPSNALGSGPGGSGSRGACSPYRPASASSQMVPSPDPPASYWAAPVAAVQLPQPGVQAAHVQQANWSASRCLDTLGAGLQLPQLPPFCLPVHVPAGPGGHGSGGTAPPQFGEEPAERQQPYNLPCLDMDFELSRELGSGSMRNESSPATMIGLHALMDEVQEHGDELTSTLMVNSDIFKPMTLQGTGEAERERLAREAARALRLLHGDSITPSPSPECNPLLPMHSTLRLPPPVLEAPGQQQQQQQQQQQPQAVPQQQQAAAVPQQPGGWLWQLQVPPQVQVPPMAQKPVDSTAAAAPKPLPLERLESSALTSIPGNVWGGSSSSSGGSGGSGGSSSDWGQVSSGGSESSGGCEASGACSDGGVAALLALCSIAKQPEIQSACMQPAPAVQQPGEQQQQRAKPKPRPPRARQQAQRAQQKQAQQAQQAQQTQRAARKPRKPRNPVASDSGSESKSPAAAAKLGVKRGSLARAAPASSPAAKRARAAPAASKASAAPACKLAARTAGKAAAGSSNGPGKPEPKRALSIELLEAEGCFDMQQDKAAAHMGFGKTWFKEAIKKIGIERWPYRQLSTLKQSVLLPLEEAIDQHGRLCSPRRKSELLAAVRAEYTAVRDKAMHPCAPEDSQSGQDSKKDGLLSDAMRGLRQDIAYKPRNEAKRAAGEGASIPEEKLEREVQRVVHKWHAKLCQP